MTETDFYFHQKQVALDEKKAVFHQMVNAALGWEHIEEGDFYESVEEYIDFCKYCEVDTSALIEYSQNEIAPLEKEIDDFEYEYEYDDDL